MISTRCLHLADVQPFPFSIHQLDSKPLDIKARRTETRMDPQEVQKVANLARLRLSEEELADCGRQLTTILDYVRTLDEVDTTSVEPLTHAIPSENVFRDDVVRPSLPVSDALANAPKSDGRYFLVPPILEQKPTG
jgi:aspartyl-tRNA(Asn)/glutamyl-tRNA(Gln) amidotransferase subunit C